MKKWEDPAINRLGIADTFEEEITPIDSMKDHYCHDESQWHSGNCEQGKGHKLVATGDCKDHIVGIENHTDYSCCCLS